MKPVIRDKSFTKHYIKRIAPNKNLVNRFNERAVLFAQGMRNEPLNDHPLSGSKAGMRAFSITGDMRVVSKEVPEAYIFLDVGSHNQVY